MKTKALRLHGKSDLRLEEITLPPIKENELLVKIICDSLCMSSYKSAKQGGDHYRVPDDVADNPTVIGHELAGEIIEVGAKYTGRFKAGQKFALQPAMNHTIEALGYSFPYIGGNMQYAIVPEIYIESGCVLTYDSDSFFEGALAEPYSCVIGAAHSSYHTSKGVYEHIMGIREGGSMAAFAACGPMGLAFIDYIINCPRKPSVLIVADIDEAKLAMAARRLSPEKAAKQGIKLQYVNMKNFSDPVAALQEVNGGNKYDDVFVFVPVASLIEQADALLAYDGCMNFFPGPNETDFKAPINFYNVHYNMSHIVGVSGGNTDDMKEALEMSASGKTNPALLVSHIGGLDSAAEATLNLPNLPGAKKLIYSDISMPLTAITDFAEKGKTEPLFKGLAEICAKHNGLWSAEAEIYLLENGTKI